MPEPQELVTDFFAEHAGDAGSAGAFAAFAGQLIRSEIMRVYPDLDDDWSADLDRLLAVAADGRISAVAFAGLDLRSGTRQGRVPRITDADEVTVPEIRGGDRAGHQASAAPGDVAARPGRSDLAATRRPLETATAGGGPVAVAPAGQDESSRESPDPGGASRWLRVRRLLAAPRIKLRRPGFRKEDLESLEVTFDAIGEAIEKLRRVPGERRANACALPAHRDKRAGSCGPARSDLQPGFAGAGAPPRRDRRVAPARRLPLGCHRHEGGRG